jgi:hypothetical protein
MMRSVCEHKTKNSKAWRIETAISAGFILFIIRKAAYRLHLGVKRAEEIDVPGTLHLELGALRLALRSYIDEVVRVIAQCYADAEWALPWRRQLVHALRVLDKA